MDVPEATAFPLEATPLTRVPKHDYYYNPRRLASAKHAVEAHRYILVFFSLRVPNFPSVSPSPGPLVRLKSFLTPDSISFRAFTLFWERGLSSLFSHNLTPSKLPLL